jgi:Trypsin-like peptidase domain
MKLAVLLVLCTLLLSCSSSVPATPAEPQHASPDVKTPIVWVKYEYEARLSDGSIATGSGSGSGVIVSNENDELHIYTNRHVIDCGVAEEPCIQRFSERVTVRTQDGKLHAVDRVAVAPHHLDIAMLTVHTRHQYRAATYDSSMNVGDRVIAVGYPSYAQRVLEFSEARGRITALKDLLMDDGYAFASIESDAYTSFGSSGGGLFNERGDLIGINTWGDAETPYQRSIAIRLSALEDIEAFSYCEDGYLGPDDACYPYCSIEQVLGTDGHCYDPCTDFYCQTTPIYGGDDRCTDEQYILGEDGWCHLPCGSPSRYCSDDAICYRNTCAHCPAGAQLFTDGNCYET